MKKNSVVSPPRLKTTTPYALYFPYDSRKKIISQKLNELALKKIDLDFTFIYALPHWMVMYQGIGAPVAGMGLECLIHSGVKTIILLGVCGSLNPDDQIGKAIVVTQAFSQEGTSPHYFPERREFQSSNKLNTRLKNFLRQNDLAFKSGRIVSTDAPYRETPSWIKDQQLKGISYVDMETSAVLAIAQYYQIEATALHLVSDIVTPEKWQPGFHSSQLEEKIEKYFFPLLTKKI
jgi:uridine phosphorylase